LLDTALKREDEGYAENPFSDAPENQPNIQED
jgi:hypothetical protein